MSNVLVCTHVAMSHVHAHAHVTLRVGLVLGILRAARRLQRIAHRLRCGSSPHVCQMLIAMMAKTFDDVWESQALNHREFHSRLVMSYHIRSHVPPPLSLPLLFTKLIFSTVVGSSVFLMKGVRKIASSICECIDPSGTCFSPLKEEEEEQKGDGESSGKVMWECTGTQEPLKGKPILDDKLGTVLQAWQEGTPELENPTLMNALTALRNLEKAKEGTDEKETEEWDKLIRNIKPEVKPENSLFIKGKPSEESQIKPLYFVPYYYEPEAGPLKTNQLQRDLANELDGDNNDTSTNTWRTSFKKQLRKVEKNTEKVEKNTASILKHLKQNASQKNNKKNDKKNDKEDAKADM